MSTSTAPLLQQESLGQDTSPSAAAAEEVAAPLAETSTSSDAGLEIPTRTSGSRKRVSEKQISKDDPEEEDESNSEDEENQAILKRGFSRASETVLKNRRIVRAKRHPGHADPIPMEATTTTTTTTAALETHGEEATELESATATSTKKLETVHKKQKTESVNPFAAIVFSNTAQIPPKVNVNNVNIAENDNKDKIVTASFQFDSISNFKSFTSPIKDTVTKTVQTRTAETDTDSHKTQKPQFVFGSASGLSFTTSTGFGAFTGLSSAPFTWGMSSQSQSDATTTTGFTFGKASTSPSAVATGTSLFSPGASSRPAYTSTATRVGQEEKYKDHGHESKKDNDHDKDDEGDDQDSHGEQDDDKVVEEENDDNNFTSTLFVATQSSVTNGEEQENCIFQGRAKLFTQVEVATLESEPCHDPFVGSRQDPIVPSVPPSSSAKLTLTPSNTQLDDSSQNNITQDSAASASTTHDRSWKEVGIGPLRLLETKPMVAAEKNVQEEEEKQTKEKEETRTNMAKRTRIRIVQRRETTPGGPGTKLILNVPITALCRVIRLGDKFVQLMTYEAKSPQTPMGTNNSDTPTMLFQPVLYLFKVKTVNEVDALHEAINAAIQKVTV